MGWSLGSASVATRGRGCGWWGDVCSIGGGVMGVVFGKPLTPAEVARRVWDAGYPTKEPCYVCAAVDARTTVDNLSGIYPMCEGCILQCAGNTEVSAVKLLQEEIAQGLDEAMQKQVASMAPLLYGPREPTAEQSLARADDWERLAHSEREGRMYSQDRANRLSDECGTLRAELDELLRENAVLRRKVEKLERSSQKGKVRR